MRPTQPRHRLCVIVHAQYPLDVRVAREVRTAVAAGLDVDIVALRGDGEAKIEVVDGATVLRLPFSHRRGVGTAGVLWEYLGFTALASFRVSTRALRRRYDIVQVHNPPDFLIVAALVPSLLGAHVVLDIHDLSPDMFAMRFDGRRGTMLADRLLRRIEAWATRFADVVVTVHEPYRRELVERGVLPRKLAVVMNSLDERLLPTQNGVTAPEGFRVVYHGTVTPPYGVELMIEAGALVVDDIADLKIEIYGEGDSLPSIQARSAELGIAERVRTSGRYLPHAEVLQQVAGASVGVIPNLPTRLNKFALSSKLFEYVALGVPVVCADLPTLSQHFSEEEVLFFRAGDCGSLAEALRMVALDPDGASARARAAAARYQREYAWAANAQRYVEALERAVGARRRRRPSFASGSRAWPGSLRAVRTWLAGRQAD